MAFGAEATGGLPPVLVGGVAEQASARSRLGKGLRRHKRTPDTSRRRGRSGTGAAGGSTSLVSGRVTSEAAHLYGREVAIRALHLEGGAIAKAPGAARPNATSEHT